MLSSTRNHFEAEVAHDCTGSVTNPGGKSFAAWLEVKHATYEPYEISYSLHPHDSAFAIPHVWDNDGTIRIDSTSPYRHATTVRGVNGWRLTSDAVRGKCAEYDIDCLPDGLTDLASLLITVELLRPTCLRGWRGMMMQSYDGTITRTEDEELIEWNDGDQVVTARCRFDYESFRAPPLKATVQVQRPCFVIDRVPVRWTRFAEVADWVEEFMAPYCDVLSLCGRAQNPWYEISVRAVPTGAQAATKDVGVRRRSLHRRDAQDDASPLVDHRDLLSGGLRQLAERLRDHALRDVIRRALVFEVASRERASLEHSYVLINAGLECLIQAVREYPALPKPVLRRLGRAVRETVAEVLLREGVDAAAGASCERKLGELARPPIEDLVVFEAQRLGVKTDDLWPAEVGFKQGLHAALRYRNQMVHAAQIDDVWKVHDELVRLQVLVERILLRLLAWPDERVWVHHDSDVKGINSAWMRRRKATAGTAQ